MVKIKAKAEHKSVSHTFPPSGLNVHSVKWLSVYVLALWQGGDLFRVPASRLMTAGIDSRLQPPPIQENGWTEKTDPFLVPTWLYELHFTAWRSFLFRGETHLSHLLCYRNGRWNPTAKDKKRKKINKQIYSGPIVLLLSVMFILVLMLCTSNPCTKRRSFFLLLNLYDVTLNGYPQIWSFFRQRNSQSQISLLKRRGSKTARFRQWVYLWIRIVNHAKLLYSNQKNTYGNKQNRSALIFLCSIYQT